VVNVKYTLIPINRETRISEQHMEGHSVRYLFVPELELIAAYSGFEIVETGEWLKGKPHIMR
jgi:hypothetical protein